MMGPLSRTVLLSLAAFGALSTPVSLAQSAPAQDAAVARRQHAVREAMQELQEARLAYTVKRYSDAVEHYRKALSSLPKAPATEKQQKFIRDSLSDALIAKAIDYRSVGRTDEALEFLREAIELSPDNQRAQQELVHTQDPVRTNPALSPQHVGDVAEVTRLLELAYGYMDLGKYDEAIETFQAVRRYDAYNTAAVRGLEQAQKRRSTYYQSAHDAARAKALTDVDKAWEESANETGLPPELAQTSQSDAATAANSENDKLFSAALAEMMLPEVIFEEAAIGEVVETLQNQILRFEASGIRSGRRINVSANFGKPGSDTYREIMEKRLTLKLSQVSVLDVLDLLSSQLGITYYYTPTGVELSYSGRDFGPMVERSFTVPPHFFDPYQEKAEGDEDDEDSAFIDSGKVAVRRVNPVDVLKGLGISFPEGSSARYLPSSRTLHVRNTAFNMAEIEDALNIPMGEERQIVLNVLILQVTEKDLEDLGFDWLVKVGFNGEMFGGGGLTQAASSLSGLPSISAAPAPDGDYVTGGLRSGTQVIGQDSLDKLIETGSAYEFGQQRSTKSPGIFSLRGVWTDADVAVIMRGLSQKKGVDILQNPQVVFSPAEDEQIVFANVREMYYPDNYDPPRVPDLSGWSDDTAAAAAAAAAAGVDPAAAAAAAAARDGDWLSELFGYVLGDNSSGNWGGGYWGGSGSNSSSTPVAAGAHPTDFVRYGISEEEMGGIGTILQVHSAEVKDDGQFVDLALTTTVNEFEGFINWGSPIMNAFWKKGSGTGGGMNSNSQNVTEITLSENYILKPIFKRNMVNTAVTVVPGTVLVFAGLQEAKTVRYEDKVPVLGDLPLVGRFFRSEGEENTRKVLLYLARVDLVDPAGRDVRTGERPGGIMQK